MDKGATSFLKEKNYLPKKISAKQTCDKRKWKMNVKRWGLQVEMLGMMGEPVAGGMYGAKVAT